LPASSESRIGEFAELVATAIANVEARSELAASRARMVAAADDERRRVVRDLHDGTQQRLVRTIITLKLARRALEQEQEAAPALVGEALHNAERTNVELRELAHGILPAVLTSGGLRAGVGALASRMQVPVDNGARRGRHPPAPGARRRGRRRPPRRERSPRPGGPARRPRRRLRVESAADSGTLVTADIPLPS